MKTISTIEILEAAIGSPITRNIVKGLSKYCNKDQKNRVEIALELYTGKRKKACFSCKASEKIIAQILKRAGGVFGLSEEDIKKNFENQYWIKGLSSTIKGVAFFGVNKPFTSGAPYQIVWDVTYACNLKCKHCYATAGKTYQDELTNEEAKKAIDIFDKAGVTIIAFSGGEPLVRPDIYELTRYASNKGIYVAIATNGTLITKSKAKEMKNAGISFIQISLDGANAKTHDEFRGIKGSFEKTCRGIKNCVQAGFFTEISTTMTKFNYKEIPDIIKLSEKLGANWFMTFNFVPTGRGKEVLEYDLTPEEREMVLKNLWEQFKVRKIDVLSTAPQFARVALQQESKSKEKVIPTHFYNPKFSGKLLNLAEFIGGCGAGRFYMGMRANGDLQPCVFFPMKIGNIKEDDFENLWRNNPILKDLRNKDILEENCGSCEYKNYCGGCRARAYGYTGNYLAPDPGCINNIDIKI